jgi:aldose 1-epimerase
MNIRKKLLIGLIGMVSISGCENKKGVDSEVFQASVTLPTMEAFELQIDGKQTSLYYLKNKNNVHAAITNYGGRLISLFVPDKNGELVDVIVGFDNLKSFTEGADTFFGATIGRYGNRIANGKFVLDGVEYSLATNNGANHLHGGNTGYSRVLFDAIQVDEQTLELNYLSKDMEEGYPGNLTVKVTYILTDDNELRIEYQANTDKKTVVNLTNHAFFNLNGVGSNTILDHVLEINSDRFTSVDETLIPTGEFAVVDGTPFDFRKPTTVGARIEHDHEQLKFGMGYDHNFVLNIEEGKKMNYAGSLLSEKSGIFMEIFTQEPGIQFYSGNFMNGANKIKNNIKDEFRSALCLETQHFPDSPNKPEFPSTELNPGEKYSTATVYKFSVK